MITHSISADDLAALNYIANPDKTENGRLIITEGCSSDPLQASHDFVRFSCFYSV